MLKRYSVIAFQTIAPRQVSRSTRLGGEAVRAEERGGGVCFVPVDDHIQWPSIVERIVHEHFHHPLGRGVEIGVASLDEDQLSPVCRRVADVYWQGGDA